MSVVSDEFGGDLHVEIDHGGQRVSFDSPGAEEGANTSGFGEDEFGGLFSTITKPFRKIARLTVKVAVVLPAKFSLNAARAAGHGAHSLVKVTNGATGVIAAAARQIPVVGKPLGTAIGLSTGPIKFADAVASGERIDRAALQSLKKAVADVRGLAPYAQIVAASVPGIGTGVAVGIAAGSALADGRPVNEAVVSACKAAIPGGAAGQMAFSAAVAAGQGGSPGDIAKQTAIAALPPVQRTQIQAAMEVASAAAGGKPLDKAALAAATSSLDPQTRDIAGGWIGKPGANSKVYDALTQGLTPEVKRALVSGVALGFAKERQRDLQSAAASPQARDALIALGKGAIAKSEVLRVAQAQVPDRAAFELGIGLMQCCDVPRGAVLQFRDSLKKGRSQLSFDSALTIHVGATTSSPHARGTSAKRRVGYYSVVGSLTGSKQQRAGIVKTLAKRDPEAALGVAVAVKEVRRRRSLWRRIVEWLRTPSGTSRGRPAPRLPGRK